MVPNALTSREGRSRSRDGARSDHNRSGTRLPQWPVLRQADDVDPEEARIELKLLGKDPELTAALLTMGLVDSRDLPLLAAHWMAAGNDGVSLVEMACLTRGDVREISDRWPSLLAEVCPNFNEAPARRHAAQYLANEYLEGRLGLRQLLQALWPCLDDEPSDPILDEIVYQLDELADTLAARQAPASERHLGLWPGAPTPADLEHDIARGTTLLAEGDFTQAHAALRGMAVVPATSSPRDGEQPHHGPG